MRHMGFKQIAIADHDRGSYTAFSTAMNHPIPSHTSLLSRVPIIETLERCDARFATAWWHWVIGAQTRKSERRSWLIRTHRAAVRPMSWDQRISLITKQLYGMVEDYRAGICTRSSS
jgi:haloacetate dehalogenase